VNGKLSNTCVFLLIMLAIFEAVSVLILVAQQKEMQVQIDLLRENVELCKATRQETEKVCSVRRRLGDAYRRVLLEVLGKLRVADAGSVAAKILEAYSDSRGGPGE
jgi:hypothetical protein